MVAIQWPLNTAPGLRAQDGAGRLINVYAEPRQNNVGTVWRRVPGCIVVTTIYPSTLATTGTATVAYVGAWTGPSGGVAALTGTGTATFVGST